MRLNSGNMVLDFTGEPRPPEPNGNGNGNGNGRPPEDGLPAAPQYPRIWKKGRPALGEPFGMDDLFWIIVSGGLLAGGLLLWDFIKE